MSPITLKAHYDGEKVQIDEPFDLLPDTPLLITVISPSLEEERLDWIRFSKIGLARAYSDDEPEYTQADLKP